MGTRIGRHLRSQFVGYIALVLAMSGTAYAIGANSIGDKQLANNSVGSSEIEPGAVKSSDLQEGSVGAEQLAMLGRLRLHRPDPPRRLQLRPGGHPAGGRKPTPDQAVSGALLALRDRYGGSGTNEFPLPKLTSADGTTRYAVCVNGYFPPRP